MKRQYHKWKKTGLQKLQTQYKKLKLRYRKSILLSRYKFEQKLTLSANFRSLFKYINKCNDNSQNITKLLDSNGSCIENPQDISNIFNKYFISVYNYDGTVLHKPIDRKANTSSFF